MPPGIGHSYPAQRLRCEDLQFKARPAALRAGRKLIKSNVKLGSFLPLELPRRSTPQKFKLESPKLGIAPECELWCKISLNKYYIGHKYNCYVFFSKFVGYYF